MLWQRDPGVEGVKKGRLFWSDKTDIDKPQLFGQGFKNRTHSANN
jgi:hypothetical protein